MKKLQDNKKVIKSSYYAPKTMSKMIMYRTSEYSDFKSLWSK